MSASAVRKTKMRYPNRETWNAFFGQLAVAELAAAVLAGDVADFFKSIGVPEMASFYREVSLEEKKHHDLLSELCEDYGFPTSLAAEDIYRGSRRAFNDSESDSHILETLVLVHLVFEPAALAFLASVVRDAHFYFEGELLDQVGKNLRLILADESRHVRAGRLLVSGLWKQTSSETRRALTKSVNEHRSFVKASIRRTFGKGNEDLDISGHLIACYDLAFKGATKGLLDVK